MSTQDPTIHLGGMNIKEWAFIILIIGLSTTIVVFGVGFMIAIQNNPNIAIEGKIDLSQFSGIVIGIALVAVTFVGQQLTAKQIVSTVKANDASWLDSQKLDNATTTGQGTGTSPS